MKERASSLGGSFNIYSEAGYGTVITIVLPVIE
jgi:signal transduction histidine kinase